MHISSKAYMGVETLVRLAALTAGTPCATRELAESINRSMSYTETLMARLHRAGLVRAQRGVGGGYTLARPAHRITVAEVFQALDEPQGALHRLLNASTLEPEAIQKLQGTDLLWESLKSYILLFLNGISLADLAVESEDECGKSETDA